MRSTRPGWPSTGPADLSCASTTCLTVDALGRFQRYSSSAWTTPVLFDATRGILGSLSCPTPTSCLAADARGEVYRWNGTTWSAPVTLSWSRGLVSCATATWCLYLAPDHNQYRVLSGTTSSALKTSPARLWTVECPVAGWCVAFDDLGRWTTFDGTSWTTPKALLGGAGATSVDCRSRSFCVAVTGDGNRWSRWNGTTWSTPTVLSSRSRWGGVVSCAATTMCLSADEAGDTYLYNGSTWKWLGTSTVTYGAMDIDCPTTTSCRVLDRWGRVGVYQASTWLAEQELTGLSMEDGKPLDYPSAIACPDRYSCTVTGRSKVVRLS